MGAKIYIGTSGWHYSDWTRLFYPKEITGYRELEYHSHYFNTVENNSSFYRIASEATYKIWDRMTPPDYKFSIKLNKLITHYHRLALSDDVQERVRYILHSTQVLKEKLGAILIQLPASIRYDLEKLDMFLTYFTAEVRALSHPFDIAIEFRSKHWFNDEVYTLLEEHNVALVDGQSSRYPEMRRITANITYIRLHGPKKLFASSYSKEQLGEFAIYIKDISQRLDRVYVYFNNDFHGYAIKNAKELMQLLNV